METYDDTQKEVQASEMSELLAGREFTSPARGGFTIPTDGYPQISTVHNIHYGQVSEYVLPGSIKSFWIESWRLRGRLQTLSRYFQI